MISECTSIIKIGYKKIHVDVSRIHFRGVTTIEAEEEVASLLFLDVVSRQGRDLAAETYASCLPPGFGDSS